MCITQSLGFFPVPHRIGKGVVTKTQFLWKTTVCNRRRGLMGKCAWFRWWWWWTWWEKGWRGALLGAPVGDGNPCSSGRWLPWTWWKPSGQSFTCALRCSQEKGADFLKIQDCHQLPFSVGKFLKFFNMDISHLLQVVWQIQGVLTEGHWLKEVIEIDQSAPVELFSPVLCWNEVG